MPLGDAEIRHALLRELAHRARSDDSAVLEELGLCRGNAIADVLFVDDCLHGYEIKSDRDTLRRLGSQAEIYCRVLERVSLVVGAHHLEEALEVVPSWWEVVVAENRESTVAFTCAREGTRNPCPSARALVELLWLEDSMRLLCERDAARGVRGKARRFVWDRLCEVYSFEELASEVRRVLIARADRQATPASA